MSTISRTYHGRKTDSKEILALVKGDSIKVEAPRNQYEFEIHTYFGDADAYETIILPLKDYDLAVKFANFLKFQLSTAYPNGRGGSEEYNYENCPTIKDWDFWFGESEEAIFSEAWPCNWDYWGEASYDYAHLFYYDENGEKFNIEVELESEIVE